MKSFGFSQRKHSLKSRKRISRLFRTGRLKTFDFLKFRYLARNQGGLRAVVAVSKRAGNAVYRNRLKRLIREALRLSGYLNTVSIDCAFYVNKPLTERPSLTILQKHIKQFFEYLVHEKAQK